MLRIVLGVSGREEVPIPITGIYRIDVGMGVPYQKEVECPKP